MKIKPVKNVYQCEFCPKYYLRPSFAREHEKYCHKNPINQHQCFSCEHLILMDSGGNGYRSHNFPANASIYGFKCAQTYQAMYSYKAERSALKKHPKRFLGAVKMPTKCNISHLSTLEYANLVGVTYYLKEFKFGTDKEELTLQVDTLETIISNLKTFKPEPSEKKQCEALREECLIKLAKLDHSGFLNWIAV